MRCVGTGERFGADLSAGFDWNDDGADDLAVGAPDRFGAAAYASGVDVFFGGTGADSLPDVVIGDAPADLHLGTTVAGGGDLLGNGDRALCVGGYNAVNEGTLRLYGRDAVPVAAAPAPPAPGRLDAPWPNPANPRVRFVLNVERPGRWTVRVYDAAGRIVAAVHDGMLPAGPANLSWDGIDRTGRPVGSGVYLVRAESGRQADVRRFTLVR